MHTVLKLRQYKTSINFTFTASFVSLLTLFFFFFFLFFVFEFSSCLFLVLIFDAISFEGFLASFYWAFVDLCSA